MTFTSIQYGDDFDCSGDILALFDELVKQVLLNKDLAE